MCQSYVYEHVRPDTGVVFYVGKGKLGRASDTRNRNKDWHDVVGECGFDVRFVVSDISEDLAMLVERELIDKLKLLGVKLVNKTSGGQGLSGFRHSEETKQKLRAKKIGLPGVKHTEASKEKIRAANTGVVFTEERKKKIGAKAKGRPMPKHVRALLDSKNKLFRHSAATKEHLRQINIGRKHSPESIKKMSLWQIGRPKLICPHCGKASSAGNHVRWHNDNCKLKGNTEWQTNSPKP